MNREQKRDVIDIAILVTLGFAIISAVVWWLESRFGSTYALLGVGGFLGVATWVAATWFERRNTEKTLDAAADFLHETANVYVSHARSHVQSAGAFKEMVRGENRFGDYLMRTANQLADKKTRFLVDGQVQATQTADAWMGQPAMGNVDLNEFVEYE